MTPPPGVHRSGPADETQRIPTVDDMPTDPSLRIPLNRAPRIRDKTTERSYQDLIVPRVFVEPDEHMDALRQRAMRWAICRDVLAVTIMLLVLGWMMRPVWTFLGEALR